jgi:hypothetical protein
MDGGNDLNVDFGALREATDKMYSASAMRDEKERERGERIKLRQILGILLEDQYPRGFVVALF